MVNVHGLGTVWLRVPIVKLLFEGPQDVGVDALGVSHVFQHDLQVSEHPCPLIISLNHVLQHELHIWEQAHPSAMPFSMTCWNFNTQQHMPCL
eukprot:scaffold287862_cov19-Tisochrysis_lutea.AAC.1